MQQSSLNCDLCGKTFSGHVCLEQHLQSEKHKKKEREKEMHDHYMSKLQTQPTSGSLPISQEILRQPEMGCDICNIQCTGVISYQQHLNSAKHAKMISLRKMNYVTNQEDIISSTLKNNEETSEVLHSTDSTTRFCSQDQLYGHIIPCQRNNEIDVLTEPEQDPVSLIQSSTTLKPAANNLLLTGVYSNCDICKKQFSGPVPYEQHLLSTAHKKKVVTQQYLSGNNANQGGLAYALANIQKDNVPKLITSCYYTCDPCKKLFSGPVPYEQHIVSEIHRKQLYKIELDKKLMGQTSNRAENSSLTMGEQYKSIHDVLLAQEKFSSSKIESSVPCNEIQGTNEILKMFNTTEVEKKFSNVELNDSGDTVKFTTKIETSDLFVPITETLSENKNISLTSDDLFESARKNEIEVKINSSSVTVNTQDPFKDFSNCIKTLTPSELNLTIIGPNMKIDLDKIQKGNVESDIIQLPGDRISEDSKVNISNEDNLTVKTGLSVSEKQGIGNFCQYCNVTLMQQDDLLSHYESKEHFMKRWC